MKNDRNHEIAAALLVAGLTVACGGSGGGASHSTALVALTSSSLLSSVHTGNASMVLCKDPELSEFRNTSIVALDAARNRFYAYSENHEALVLIEGGELSVIGEPSHYPRELAFETQTNGLYAIQNTGSDHYLMWIDTKDGQSTNLAACPDTQGLTFDETNGLLYGVRRGSTTLISIDPADGSSQDLFSDPQLGILAGLAFDPVTRTLYGADWTATPALWEIDIAGGTLTELAEFDETITDLVFDADSGELFALTSSGLARLDGTWPDGELASLTGLGRWLDAMAFDPTDSTYFAVDATQRELVKLNPADGSYLEIGSLERMLDTLVYDPAVPALYGVEVGTGKLLTIDPATAAITEVGTTFSNPTKLAIDTQSGEIYGYDGEYDAIYLVDPIGPGPGIAVLASNVFGGGNVEYILNDLTYFREEQRLVGIGTRKVEDSPGGFSFTSVTVSVSPQGAAPIYRNNQGFQYPLALGLDTNTGVFHVFENDQPLFAMELTPNSLVPTRLTTVDRPLWRDYEAALHVESEGVVFAVDGEQLYRLDPVTGSTELLGNLPDTVEVQDLVFDEATGFVGLRADTDIVWIAPVAPWLPKGTDTLPVAPEALAQDLRSPEHYYGVSSSRFDTIEGSSSISVDISPPLAGTFVHAVFAAGENAVYASDTERNLVRFDVSTGQPTMVGHLDFEARGLYSN